MESGAVYDVVVFGAGPSGCALAISMLRHRPQSRILLLERQPDILQKAGETLPPQCRDLLEHLGLWEAFVAEDHLPAYGSKSCWGQPEPAEKEFMTSTQRNGWHLDRVRFDAFLRKKALDAGAGFLSTAGKQVYPSALPETTPDAAQWMIPGLSETVCSRLVVDATGRSANIARHLGAELVRFDRLVGVMALVEGAAVLDRDTLIEAVEQGWWYSALLPDQKMAMVFFGDAAAIQSAGLHQLEPWQAVLQQAPYTYARLQESGAVVHSLESWPAQSQRLVSPVGMHWLAVGDAAAAFDPLSSQGIFFALKSGVIGSYACMDMLEGGEKAAAARWKYTQQHIEQFSGYWAQRQEFYRMEVRWPQSAFWAGRHGHIQVLPEMVLQWRVEAQKKPLILLPTDLERLEMLFPEGEKAHVILTALTQMRPDLTIEQALEGLQGVTLPAIPQEMMPANR